MFLAEDLAYFTCENFPHERACVFIEEQVLSPLFKFREHREHRAAVVEQRMEGLTLLPSTGEFFKLPLDIMVHSQAPSAMLKNLRIYATMRMLDSLRVARKCRERRWTAGDDFQASMICPDMT